MAEQVGSGAAQPAPAKRPGRMRVVGLLVLLPLGMASLAFFGMPRLYSLWCKVTGTGVRPNNPEAALADAHTGRFVEVFFESKVYDHLPVTFDCDHVSVTAEVGRESGNTYRLTNTSDRALHIRPIHQVSPITATPYFGMRLCFCFSDQTIAPHETRVFPVAFTFAPELDPRTATVSVCYSLFEIAPDAPRSAEQERIQRQVAGAGGVVTPGFKVMSEAELARLREQETASPPAKAAP